MPEYDPDDLPTLTPRGAVPHVLRFGPQTRLRRKIAESGWPAYQVAAAAGISPITLSHYLNLKKKLSGSHLMRLSKVLGCEPEELEEDDDRA